MLEPLVVPGLTLTVDYWRIKQSGIHGVFGLANFSALDYAARLAGGSEQAVIRRNITPDDEAFFRGSGLAPAGEIIRVLDPFLNLDSRVSTGVDIELDYQLQDTGLGDFRFGIQASRLIKAFQTVSTQGAAIIALGEPAISVTTGGDLIEQNGRPKWQGSASVNWSSGDWAAGAFAHYVGAISNTSAINDTTNAFYRVGSWLTVNTNIEYRLALSSTSERNARLRLGVNNLFDRDPPLTNGAIGYNAGLHTPFGRTWYATTTVEF